jgi:hypothetical protein
MLAHKSDNTGLVDVNVSVIPVYSGHHLPTSSPEPISTILDSNEDVAHFEAIETVWSSS